MTLIDTERALRRGIAAQDFRASRARAVDRPDALLCAECGTELDVAEPAHNPLRPCWAPPEPPPSRTQTRAGRARARQQKRKRRWVGTGFKSMRRISALSHTADGDVTMGELDRRHAAWAALQPMTIWCAICGKRYQGEARRIVKLLRSHMILKHPRR